MGRLDVPTVDPRRRNTQPFANRQRALTAFGIAVEVGKWNRFIDSPIGAYIGLVPTESSSR